MDGQPKRLPKGLPGELTLEQHTKHRDALFLVSKAAIDAAIAGQNWKRAAALLRANALTVCKGAEHGWPGGSFSCIELLLALHLRCPDAEQVVLSKGHAAAAQYAVLHAAGRLPPHALRNYKLGAGCPEAHADFVCDTGSLGQCLSVVGGMAAAARGKRFAIVLGDGELQEGQNYEALMTLRHHGLTNVTLFIDLNEFQSDNRCDEIMKIHDLPTVLRGFGFDVVALADGHDSTAVAQAWREAEGKHVAVLCPTFKGLKGFMEPSAHPVTKLDWQPWHTKIPPWPMYVEVIDALVRESESEEALAEWSAHRANSLTDAVAAALPDTQRPAVAGQGTGKAFGQRITALLETNPKLAIIDADLATSCGWNEAVGHKRYFELGVAEQDAASFAAGLALGSEAMIPVFGTYSNFLKRCFENIFINQAQGARVVYAGHYSGLCYHTDGKSHQSINDLSVFAGMPGLITVDPVTPQHAAAVADWAVGADCSNSVYVRLRRTPCPAIEALCDQALKGAHPVSSLLELSPDAVAVDASPRGVAFVTIGTVPTELALKCRDAWAKGAKIVVVPSINGGTEIGAWRSALFGTVDAPVDTIITIEDDAGALRSLVAQKLVECHSESRGPDRSLTIPRLVSKTVAGVGPSFRSLPACLDHFGFTVDAIKALAETK